VIAAPRTIEALPPESMTPEQTEQEP